MDKLNRKYGFTIVELLVVIVVIAVLAAITIVAYNGIQARARDSQRDQDIKTVAKALELYYIDNGQYPAIAPNGSTGAGLGNYWATTTDGSWSVLASALAPKYLSKLPEEPIKQLNADPRYGTALGYAYYPNTSTYCGKAPLQMYLLVYKRESGTQNNTYIGDCATNVLAYGAASNYRVSK
jgi:general secretion pathway protein G